MAAHTYSVNDFFKGIGHRRFGIQRARAALDRFLDNKNPFNTPSLLFDCAITVSCLSDWTFHTEVKGHQSWNDFASKKGADKKFTEWVASRSVDNAVIQEISNTAKHFHRMKPNILVNGIRVTIFACERTGRDGEVGFIVRGESSEDIQQKVAINRIDVELIIQGVYLGAEDVIGRAIAWWETFDPTTAPTHKGLR